MELKVSDQSQALSPKLRADSIYKSYQVGGQPAPVLQGISLSVDPGEFVSLIGPSGCGKSTLLNIIAGLDHPDAGTVELDGDIHAQRLGNIGYMQQKDLLLPWRSVLDNAALGLELQGISRGEARRRALALTGLFGLKGFEHQYPFTFSGIKIGISVSVIAAVIGEWVGASEGLGYLITYSQPLFLTARVFAAIVVLSAMGMSLFTLASLAERLMLPWYHTEKQTRALGRPS